MMFWLKDLLCVKGSITYNKVHGIAPMTTHVQTTNLKLFAMKKQLNEVEKLGIMFSNQGKKGQVLLAMQLFKFLVPQTHTKKLSNTINFWKF
jgi:hypothetical protein